MIHLIHYVITRFRRSISGIGVAIGLIADAGDIEAIGEELF